MMHRLMIAAPVLAAAFLSGCSLPRGPINVNPFLPRWLTHGEIGPDCPPQVDEAVHPEAIVNPHTLAPPVPKFHPVPTRPVFEPQFSHPL
jgi:hypothetical protein